MLVFLIVVLILVVLSMVNLIVTRPKAASPDSGKSQSETAENEKSGLLSQKELFRYFLVFDIVVIVWILSKIIDSLIS